MSASDRGVSAPDRAEGARSGASLTDLLLLLMAFIWAVNYSVAKFGTTVVHPLAYNGVRIALAAATFLVVSQFFPEGRPSRRDALALVGLGVLGNGIYQICFIQGLAHSRAGTVSLLFASTPAVVALLGLLRRERLHRRGWYGIALQLAGAACVVLGSSSGASRGDSPLGTTLIIAGVVCWAVFSVLVRPYAERVSGIHVGALTLSGGAMLVVAAAVPSIAATRFESLAPSVWAAIVYSGIAALVVANLFWFRGVRVLGPTRVAMYANVQPLIAIAIAWITLGEVPTVWQGIGAGSIVSGLLVTRA